MVIACRQHYNVKYVRLPELLDEFIAAKNEADGSFRKLIKKYKKVELLIIDEWLLTDLLEENDTLDTDLTWIEDFNQSEEWIE
ncbi:MAG: ATP-binding protein [Oscillospiraceae bacterium]